MRVDVRVRRACILFRVCVYIYIWTISYCMHESWSVDKKVLTVGWTTVFFLYNVHRSLATDPYFLFCSWLSHTSERGWGGGRGRWGRYILRVSYNLTNIQTFRGVCNSEECISEVVALNSIRRCLMIFWFFFFLFFFSDDRADDDSRREINRSNGISANRGRGRTNVYIYTRNELVDQRAAWLNRFYLTNLPRCPRLTHFVFLFFLPCV